MDDIKRAYSIKKLYNKLMDKTDPKKSLKEKIAEVTAQLDKRLGPIWRKHAQPEGIEVVQIEEGGKLPENSKPHFFDKVREWMLEEDLSVIPLVDTTELPPDKPEKSSLKQRVKVAVEICND